jgi:hypothetical protein
MSLQKALNDSVDNSNIWDSPASTLVFGCFSASAFSSTSASAFGSSTASAISSA